MDKLLVSFSGGETSAYMAQYLKANHSHEYDIVYVFANTGLENEETLKFVEKCDKAWNLGVHWIETVINEKKGIGPTYKKVDYQTAARNGEPMEEVIKKYGIPNMKAPNCSRETKARPIKKFGNEYFGTTKYYTAIGIRADEFDRVNSDRHKMRLVYPLADTKFKPMTKQKINTWWKNQEFRLNLKGYQGNCKTCWKKSDKKLYQIAKEDPGSFEFFRRMEAKYPRVGNEFQKENGHQYANRTFFRNNRTTDEILTAAQFWNGKVADDSQNYNVELDLFDDTESCEVWSNCGDL